eukprot:PITA_09960
MKKFFRLHDCLENMKARIVTFSLNGKANIWWEDVKNVKGIDEDVLTWHVFERLFKKKYLSKRTKVDCFDKAIECVDDSCGKRTLKGKKKPTSVTMITTMHAKCSCIKICVVFGVKISSDKGKEVEGADVLSKYPVLQQFQDVFPKDITEFPPHKEVEFYIELVLGSAPTSKTPYKMSTPELVELKLHLKEMLDKEYIRPNVLS